MSLVKNGSEQLVNMYPLFEREVFAMTVCPFTTSRFVAFDFVYLQRVNRRKT